MVMVLDRKFRYHMGSFEMQRHRPNFHLNMKIDPNIPVYMQDIVATHGAGISLPYQHMKASLLPLLQVNYSMLTGKSNLECSNPPHSDQTPARELLSYELRSI